MTDPFEHHTPGLESPAICHYGITPSEEPLQVQPRAIRVNGGGTLILRDINEQDVSYTVDAGEVLVFRPTHVLPGSTATGIVGWY